MPSRWAIFLVMLALADAADLHGQAFDALHGRVVVAGTGAPLSEAIIQAEGPASRSTLSDARGEWRIAGLPAGEYTIRVRHLGFTLRSLPVRLPWADEGGLTAALTPEALPLDAVVVTASRRIQRLADAAVTTELISRREIEQSGMSDLSRVLMERTGIQLEGGHPAGEGVMLQGLSSERVLVLLDGQPLVGRISGQVDLSRIPTSMVERVEILKGPQSSLYGSEAMGGVVNVITRTASPEPWNLGIGFTGGSQGRIDAASTLRGTLGSIQYLFDAGRRTTDLTPGRAQERGALAERWDGLFKLGWARDSSLVVEASGLLLDERQRWQGGQLFNFADNRQSGAQLGAAWTLGSHRFAPTIYWSQFDHLSRRATAPEPVAGTGDEEVQRLFEGELLYNGGFGAHALDVGIEAKREETVSDRVVDRERTLHTVEPFAQATWTLGSLSLVPGARVTWSEQWGTHLSPRLAALYRPVPPLALRVSVGRGFRAPAFKELYMEFLNLGAGVGYTVRGNPDLLPETSTNVSGGVEWAAGPIYLRGQAFHNSFSDFIETRLVGDSTGITVYSYGNIANGFTRGVELEGGIVYGAIRAEGGYGFLEARESESREPLLGRPKHSGRFSLEAAASRGPRAALTAVYTGRSPIQRTDAGLLERDGFLRFDGRLTQALPSRLELSLGVRNLLDTQPERWPGFAGRHLYLGIGWTAAAAR